MPEEANQTANTIEVPAGPAEHGGANPGELLKPAPLVLGLQWVIFIIVGLVLYKVAWRPIMLLLETRENSIKKALEDAEKARQELASMQEKSHKLMEEASAKSREIVDSARASAVQIGDSMKVKARQESDAMIANARREIDSAVEMARNSLRAECGKLAVELAGKIVSENLDTEKNRVLSKKLIEKV